MKEKLGEFLSGASCVVAFITMVGTKYYYTWHMPVVPDHRDGRIFEVAANYGRVVYVTRNERNILYMAYAAFAISAVIVFAKILKKRKLQ